MAARSDDPTTIHVRRALGGDSDATEWIVQRFTPLLLAQARYRMGSLRELYEPEDIVAGVWTALLHKLGDVPLDRDRATPTFVRYLTTALLFEVNNLLRKRVARTVDESSEGSTDRILATPDDAPGPTSRVVRSELRGRVLIAIDELNEADREVLILRGIEQHANADVAALLGIDANTAAQRYRRALGRLRERIPGSVFDELED